MDRVAVLMSTYNGEKFLAEQIESILAQEGVEITLFIRDDGSTDQTIRIIREFSQKHSEIVFMEGKNVGVGNSFMQLVYGAGEAFDFYGFSDQDDVWLPQKVRQAVESIRGYTIPVLYCSNQLLVDKEGARIGMRHERMVDTSFCQILCNNQISGCTMLWNASLQRLLTDAQRRPSEGLLRKRIHDVWVAMVASVTGKIVYDENACILYRQHENNVVGVKKQSILREWREKLRNKGLRNGRSSLATEILANYRDRIESERIRETLRVCSQYASSAKDKLSLLRDPTIRKCSDEGLWMYGVKILFELF